MSESDEILDLRYEQGAWRAVHLAAAAAGLDDAGCAVLRAWTAHRMRNLPFSVFHPSTVMAGRVRASFLDALAHAADAIVHGRVPE